MKNMNWVRRTVVVVFVVVFTFGFLNMGTIYPVYGDGQVTQEQSDDSASSASVDESGQGSDSVSDSDDDKSQTSDISDASDSETSSDSTGSETKTSDTNTTADGTSDEQTTTKDSDDDSDETATSPVFNSLPKSASVSSALAASSAASTSSASSDSYTWTGSNSISYDDLISGIGDAGDYAVFARTFTNDNHMEGNIAVETLLGCSSQMGNTSNVSVNITSYSVTITKTVKNVTGEKKFNFGVFKKNSNGTYTQVNSATVTTDSSTGKGSATVSGNFGSNTKLYVFELDDSGNPITDKSTTGVTIGSLKYKVEYDSTTDGTVTGGSYIMKSDNTSYIKYLRGSGSNMINQGQDAKLVVGDYEGVVIGTDVNGNPTITNNKGASYDVGVGATVSKTGDPFPIDFTSDFDRLNDLSKTLATAKTTTDSSANVTVSVINMKASDNGFSTDLSRAVNNTPTSNETNYATNTGFKNLATNEYLIVNIDCTDVSAYTITRFATPSYTDTWDPAASRIIFNFVKKDSSGNYVPYTGNIFLQESVGTILAPSATVTGTTTVVGEIIANTVSHSGGEIHKKVIGKSGQAHGTLSCTNTAEETGKEVKFKKTDLNTGKEISGAKLQIKDSSGNVVDSWTSDSSSVHTATLMPGTYTLEETEAPEGYKEADAITFIVKSDGTITNTSGTAFSNKTVTMTDQPLTKVSVNKLNDSSESISGALLCIQDLKGNQIGDSWTSEKGKTHDVYLEDGYYKLVELSAPEGYKTAQSITFTVSNGKVINSEGTTITDSLIEMVDLSIPKTTIRKTDVGGNLVAGATLTLTSQDGSYTKTWVTDADNAQEVYLDPGTYTITEVFVPNGYKKAADISFIMTDDGKITDLLGNALDNNKVTMVDEAIPAVYFQKTDVGGNELSGAVLTVKKETGETVESWTSDGTSHVVYLDPGTYILEETTAPNGYDKADSITFIMNSDGTVSDENGAVITDKTITMVDEVTPTEGPIEAIKTLENGTLKKGDFTFELLRGDFYNFTYVSYGWGWYVATNVTNSGTWKKNTNITVPMPDGSSASTAAVKNRANGKVNFGSITYEQEGVYTYQIREKVPAGVTSDTPCYGDIKYDTNTYYVAVLVQWQNSGDFRNPNWKLNVTGVYYYPNSNYTYSERLSSAPEFVNEKLKAVEMPETGRNGQLACYLLGSLLTLVGIYVLTKGRRSETR